MEILNISSILVAICALFISYQNYSSQKAHNKNSVRPILNIILGDYQNTIFVKIVNNGVGPATIIDANFIKQSLSKKSLIEIIETNHTYENITYLHFVHDIIGKTIPPAGSITFLKVQADSKPLFALRNDLKSIDITIKYVSIYEDSWTVNRDLSYFGRTLDY